MKYCIPYQRNSSFRYLDEVDELEITYRKEDTTLPTFLAQHTNQTIVILVEDIEGIDAIHRLSNLYTKYTNFKIKISLNDSDMLDAVLSSNIPFFFSIFVDNWDLFTGIVDLHPTDIYIGNELGFELNKIAKIAHNNNIQIRVFPNIAQSNWEKTKPIKKFFIRPEDINIYESVVDVFEFFCDDIKLSTYYDIYAHNQKWFGKLSEIIQEFDTDLDNRCIPSIFATTRIGCNKKCVKTHNCHICERIEFLAKTLEQQHLIIADKEKD